LLGDTSGNLFGTTYDSGGGRGVVFELTAAGEYQVLYDFCVTEHSWCWLSGANPLGRLVSDEEGNLYGETAQGGGGAAKGLDGTVFRITRMGRERVLARKLKYLWGSPIIDKAGNLYGSSQGGGDFDLGQVFKISRTGQFFTLYSFCPGGVRRGCPDGSSPSGGLVMDGVGNLYGTTQGGGTNGAGTVFEITRGGRYQVLYSFCSSPSCADGGNPIGDLAIDAFGNLYGTTFKSNGTVFELSP
jgi:uncharacterized repeat protein (TIGR03803 family)